MFSVCRERNLAVLIVIFLFMEGATGFFVKHVQTGMCINDTSIKQGNPESWGHLIFLELSDNCLDPAAQFQFRDNSAMLNLERQSCLIPRYRDNTGYNLDMLYIYVAPAGVNQSCTNNAPVAASRTITQTSWGGLSISYNAGTWCAVNGHHQILATNQGIDPYVKLTTPCADVPDQRFNLGSVTCYGNNVENANCPKDQYMVVKTASYRGLSATKTCSLSDDYRCEVNVTCPVKKQCDGQHECDITVDDMLFSANSCQGFTRYLYFEYQCIDSPTPYVCVDGVSLSSSSLPNEGFVQIKYNGTKSVCWQSLKNSAGDVVCRQMGYIRRDSLVEKPAPSGIKDEIFSGSINCNGGENDLSQCSIDASTKSCSELSYMKCHICNRTLLEDKQRFPDSLFNASDYSEGHNASDARISSGSSWCAPVSVDKHYLQVDLERLYVIYNFVTFGDSTSPKWVTTYNLNYTVDLINWTPLYNISGNKNAYNDAAIRPFGKGITTKALRFIPLSYVDQPCMRIEICGVTRLPDKLTNLTVTDIKPRSAEISWLHPENTGDGDLTGFWIKLKKNKSLIQNTTTNKYNKYEIDNLTPYTTYEITVAAGNKHGFGEGTITSFMTSEDVPEGPPLNVSVIVKNSSSLSVTWEPPEKDKRNGIIVNYTVCISHEESKPCFKEYTTKKKTLVISNLNVSTKYYVRVLASTKVGRGNYSESEGKFTNGKQPERATNGTEATLTFPLQTPGGNFTHFYVVALKLKDGKEPAPSASYENNELVTYAEARNLTNPKPYIAAVVTSSGVKNTFILGDGRNSSVPTSRRRRSTSTDYYNGPLEPGANYSIFQRIFINKEGEYYSTDWSPASITDIETTTAPSPSASTTAPATASITASTTASTTVNGEMTQPGQDNNSGGDDSGNVAVIAGAVVGVCLLLILVILVIIMFRRRKNKQGFESDYQQEEVDKQGGIAVMNEAFLGNDEGEQNNHYDTVEDATNRIEDGDKTTDPTPDDSIYDNKESIDARVHNPIPVNQFNDHVNYLREDDSKQCKLEFEDLPNAHISNGDISKRAFNRPKNRYGNAVTYDHSRVILSGDEKSDYINASYINGLIEKYYIATQGPKPKTVNDLWRMIFEHNCPTIVMLTTLKEMGKVKCEKYWPEQTGMYADIKVTVTKTRTFADYVTRMFILEKGDQQHEVQQFHFVSWPDYGVPLYPTQILTFRRHFKSFHETKTGPAVIHCSAGVGRTGVFIAVDKILDDLDKEKKDTIDIFGFVKDMRTRRFNMVQTAQQYAFIHDAVVDHINCGANEVEATQVMIEIKNLSKKNKKGETGFEEKFMRLNTVSPQLAKEKCEAGLQEGNRKKNRNPDIYPSESGRPHLSYIENVENSDYINACYVDGYLGKNYFIATQTPLDGTINEFWRMVFQHNSSTIVMLNQLREDDEEYPMFWPTERAKPQLFGTTTVMFDSFVKKENIVIRKFIISPSIDLKDGRMVRIIHYMSWPDHGVPENVDDIVKLLSEVEDSQRAVEGKKGPVVVVCSDGAGRSGTYIAISNLVDRVKAVQVIDVFQCIKLIRGKRPQFVETVAQFKLCYDAVTSVLRSFNEYSNFGGVEK